ncbi:MAG: hypothetical protein L6R39_002795 [Caloplaca ligustica]|nr:MAG: hypothetical protein L6R39_002795 [Caloplaca ligustica]
MAALDQQGLLSRPTSSVLSASSAPFEANISGSADGALCSDGNTQFPADSSSSTDQPDGPESSDVSPSSRRKKLHLFASRTKEATKRLLNAPGRDDRPSGLPAEDDQPPYVLGDDAAFNLNKLDTEHRSDKGIKRKLQVNLQAVAAGIVHPKQAFKGKATRSTAGRLSKVERPYLSKDMDLDLLEAHDDLSRAQSTSSSARHTTEDDTDPGTDGLKDRVARLEAHRESLRAAYTTSRLVQRVRVVPKRHIKFPGDEYFVERNDQGERIRYDWLKWMGYVGALPVEMADMTLADGFQCILYYAQDFSAQYIDDFDQLPFSRESLQQEIERLAMASAPWQGMYLKGPQQRR